MSNKSTVVSDIMSPLQASARGSAQKVFDAVAKLVVKEIPEVPKDWYNGTGYFNNAVVLTSRGYFKEGDDAVTPFKAKDQHGRTILVFPNAFMQHLSLHHFIDGSKYDLVLFERYTDSDGVIVCQNDSNPCKFKYSSKTESVLNYLVLMEELEYRLNEFNNK